MTSLGLHRRGANRHRRIVKSWWGNWWPVVVSAAASLLVWYVAFVLVAYVLLHTPPSGEGTP